MVHQVSYDLRAPGRDYKSLYAAIKAHDSWAHPVESNWFVKTSLSAVQLRDMLAKHMDRNDKLVVVEVSRSNWATTGMAQDVGRWMSNQMPGPVRV